MAVFCKTNVRVCNVCVCLLMYLRSNLGDLVCSFDGCLSSRDSSSQQQTGTVGIRAFRLKGAHQLLQMGRESYDDYNLYFNGI